MFLWAFGLGLHGPSQSTCSIARWVVRSGTRRTRGFILPSLQKRNGTKCRVWTSPKGKRNCLSICECTRRTFSLGVERGGEMVKVKRPTFSGSFFGVLFFRASFISFAEVSYFCLTYGRPGKVVRVKKKKQARGRVLFLLSLSRSSYFTVLEGWREKMALWGLMMPGLACTMTTEILLSNHQFACQGQRGVFHEPRLARRPS